VARPNCRFLRVGFAPPGARALPFGIDGVVLPRSIRLALQDHARIRHPRAALGRRAQNFRPRRWRPKSVGHRTCRVGTHRRPSRPGCPPQAGVRRAASTVTNATLHNEDEGPGGKDVMTATRLIVRARGATSSRRSCGVASGRAPVRGRGRSGCRSRCPELRGRPSSGFPTEGRPRAAPEGCSAPAQRKQALLHFASRPRHRHRRPSATSFVRPAGSTGASCAPPARRLQAPDCGILAAPRADGRRSRRADVLAANREEPRRTTLRAISSLRWASAPRGRGRRAEGSRPGHFGRLERAC